MQELERYSENTAIATLQDNSTVSRTDIGERITVAQAYPRNMNAAYQEALSMVTMNQETASSCFYMKPVGKEKIVGASVRLAEIIAYCWGNLDIATRVISNDGKFITAQGVCMDIQRNTRVSADVSMSIKYKDGKTYNQEMQVNIANAASSKALRNAIFRVIPKTFVNQLFEAARKAAVGDIKTITERCRNAVTYFCKLGVSEKNILEYFNVNAVDELNENNLVDMIAIQNSIKDKTLTIDNAFTKYNLETGETQSPMIDDLKGNLS